MIFVLYFIRKFDTQEGWRIFTKENIRKNMPVFLRVVLISMLIGVICGLVGAVFVKSIAFVTTIRENNGWVLYLLPFFGLLVAMLYRKFKIEGTGTNHIINSVRTNKPVSPLLGVAVFFGTIFSHFGGASVGREGAALQLGGSIGEFLAEKFKIPESFRRILVMSGMSACFAALFGTPVAAFVFVLEVVRVGERLFAAIIPAFLSSATAFLISTKLGVEPESFPLNSVPNFSFNVLWKFVLIAVIGAYVSELFVYALHFSEKGFKKLFKNEYIRVFVGGVVLIALTKLVGTTDYNGGGINVIHHIFTDCTVHYEAFILKIIFTAISVGACYRGGEIVPTLFVGGAFGGAAASVLGLNVPFGAAIGIVALFSGVTNCPVSTIILTCAMFGVEGFGYFAVASIISYALSGKVSLYKGRKTPFVKNH